MSPKMAECERGASIREPGAPSTRGLKTLDNDLLPAAARDHDLAVVFQAANDTDDPLLRLFHVPQPHRPHELHILPEHVGGALGHVLVDAVLHILADSLERQA